MKSDKVITFEVGIAGAGVLCVLVVGDLVMIFAERHYPLKVMLVPGIPYLQRPVYRP